MYVLLLVMTQDTYNAAMVLKTSTDLPRTLQASGSVMSLTSSKDACGAICIKAEEDEDTDLKEEEIPEPITFPTIKIDQDVVSYMLVCREVDTFSQFENMPPAFVITLHSLK